MTKTQMGIIKTTYMVMVEKHGHNFSSKPNNPNNNNNKLCVQTDMNFGLDGWD
jgi:hypothetical protein